MTLTGLGSSFCRRARRGCVLPGSTARYGRLSGGPVGGAARELRSGRRTRNPRGTVVAQGQNAVFYPHFRSDLHAEMVVMNALEGDPALARGPQGHVDGAGPTRKKWA
jgi:hypothetical protein